MDWTNINIGAFLDDPTAERVRDAFEKVNDGNTYLFPLVNDGTQIREIFRPFTEAGEGVSELENICDIVNAYTPFTVPANQAGVVSFVQFAGGVFGTEFTKFMYLLKVGAGTYGLGETQLVPANLIKLAPVSTIPEAEFIYDVGNIGATAIHTFVNGAGPYIVSGLTVFEGIQGGEDKVWLFVGGNGNYGTGATATVADDFVDLTAQDPIPSTPTFLLPVKKIEVTPYTITADDINRPLWFTSNDQVVNVPNAFLTANTNILLYNFEAYFSGTGTHTVNHPQGGENEFEQGDYIKALRYDNAGDTLWVVSKWVKDGDVDESKWEIVQYGVLNNVGVGNLRLPTSDELNEERLSWGTSNSAGAFGSPLKLTVGGLRQNTGSIISDGTVGHYYSSDVFGVNTERLEIGSLISLIRTNTPRSYGCSVRLIVDGTFTQQQFNDEYDGEIIVIDGLTYGYVYNPTTDKIWLDRNLGATQIAASSTDTDAYGWLYQWGRLTDGHQIRTSTTTAVLSTVDVPLTDDFITTSVSPNDWRDPQNDNLWQPLLKLIGKNGLKASYNDLLDKPLRPDPTDNNRPEWDNGTEWKRLAYVDDTQGHTIKNDAGFFKIVNDADEVLFNVFGETDAVTMELRSPAGFYTSLSNIATAPRAISLPDEGGTLETKPIIALTAPSQVIGLDRTAGRIFTDEEYNATYTHTGAVAGGNATLLIDTTGEAAFPSVTGATLVTGSDFEAGETFEMHVYTLDGTNVRYFFLKIS